MGNKTSLQARVLMGLQRWGFAHILIYLFQTYLWGALIEIRQHPH